MLGREGGIKGPGMVLTVAEQGAPVQVSGRNGRSNNMMGLSFFLSAKRFYASLSKETFLLGADSKRHSVRHLGNIVILRL